MVIVAGMRVTTVSINVTAKGSPNVLWRVLFQQHTFLACFSFSLRASLLIYLDALSMNRRTDPSEETIKRALETLLLVQPFATSSLSFNSIGIFSFSLAVQNPAATVFG